MLRIGIAQMEVTLGDLEKNRGRVLQWMAQHYQPSELPTVVVLPELWNLGYAVSDGAPLADPEAQQSLDFLGDLARRYGVWFAGGSVLARCQGRLVNRALVVNPRGELVCHYDKVHLSPVLQEQQLFAAGDSPGIFEIDGIKIAQAICYDLCFPEWIRIQGLLGAKVLLVSAAWPQFDISMMASMMLGHAAFSVFFVAACNQIGISGHTVFGGSSAVVAPRGDVLYRASQDQPEGAWITVDPSLLTKRDLEFLPKDRRCDLYRRWDPWIPPEQRS